MSSPKPMPSAQMNMPKMSREEPLRPPRKVASVVSPRLGSLRSASPAYAAGAHSVCISSAAASMAKARRPRVACFMVERAPGAETELDMYDAPPTMGSCMVCVLGVGLSGPEYVSAYALPRQKDVG